MECIECGGTVEYDSGNRVTAMVDHYEEEHELCE